MMPIPSTCQACRVSLRHGLVRGESSIEVRVLCASLAEGRRENCDDILDE